MLLELSCSDLKFLYKEEFYIFIEVLFKTRLAEGSYVSNNFLDKFIMIMHLS